LSGDLDAAQKARRALLNLDALLDESEVERSWPELDDRACKQVASA
jgi:molecular chaperone DnaK